MSQVFRTTRIVQFCETDSAGIAHFSNFVVYMEQAEHELLRSIGESVMSRDEEGHISWPRVACECRFQSPVRFEDELRIDVSITKLGRSSITYQFDFSCGERAVANGSMTSVCCRVAQDTAPTSMPIPAHFLDKLQPFVASTAD